MTLRLEVGKTYVTADGTPVKIIHDDGHSHYPMDGSDGECYQRDGRLLIDRMVDGDLVSELQEPSTTATPELASATVAYHRQQFLDALMLELVRQGEGLTSGDIAETFKELVAARDAAG